MARTWFFQANPKLFDIDSALAQLDEIWWRVPQYTSEIQRGDVVLLWRSGKEAGIVGVGRVAGEPRQHASSDREKQFAEDLEIVGIETRVPVNVRATAHVSKDQVRALAGFEQHSIIRAPMGTVIPISDSEYRTLKSLVVEPPDLSESAATAEIPAPFAWEQRYKSAHPMPGGYDAYLDSLQTLVARVADERPTKTEVPGLIEEQFAVSPHRSSLLAAFLRKAGFITEKGEVAVPSEPVNRWLESSDSRVIIGLLHSRVRFIGELLQSAFAPKSTSELLDVANEQYGCRWSTKAQIDRRRGWLQSAGMLETDESNRLVATQSGRRLVSELLLQDPLDRSGALGEGPPAGDEHLEREVELSSPTSTRVAAMVQELTAASTDSSDPDRFERAVRDAFEWLGYRAEWMGGSGRTDVLLDAPLGHGQTYRVIIDCKTSSSGSVSDGQIDWTTLKEHRAKHEADYVAVVAPSPSGRRLFERAMDHAVTVIAVDELVTLCEQHSLAPLGLDSYKTLFVQGGVVDTDAAAEKAEEWIHVLELARSVVNTIVQRSERFGPLRADNLQMLLADDPVAESVSMDGIQAVLDTLASPLTGVLAGDPADGYVLVSAGNATKLRLEILGAKLFDDVEINT